MIKIFTLFNLAGLFLLNLFLGSDVSITQDMPTHMDPGSEVRATVTVNKGTISGFAKLQIDLPPGFTATAIDTRGASFTFADGKAKFIWMALPTQPSFKVSYTLSASATTKGTFPINARLSYIEDNERKTVDMPPATLAVGSGGEVAASTPAPAAPQPAEPEPAGGETGTVASSPIPDVPVTETPGLPAQSGLGDVSASRTVTAMSASEYLVEVTVNKGTLRGFGKLQENIPMGFTAIVKNNDESIFSLKDRMVKFVWLNLPSKSSVKVSYRLLAPEGAEGSHTINGEFGYLVNDLTQRAVVGSTTFTIGAAIAAETPVTTPEETAVNTVSNPTPSTKVEPAPTQPTTVQQPKATQADNVTAGTGKPKVTSIPAPETGITFKVQITAAHREVGKSYFIQRHHYDGDFSIEHHEGWIKYVTGLFDRYRAARDQRQAFINANHNFPGPFVTAYNNGERITVQEALMIAKQNQAQ